MRREEGFTLIEILVTVSLVAILMTLAAGSLRTYWLVRSLEGGGDQVVSQLRQLQEESRSESHPLVYGAWFDAGTSNWKLVRYDPFAGVGGECVVEGTRSFDAGVTISSAAFAEETDIAPKCTSVIPEAVATEFVFFYAQGSATAGEIILRHPSLPGRDRTITVTPMTGRVTSS